MGKGDSEGAAPDTASLPVRKQAVVVIHGMGEPVPMDTMRSFVDAVWEKDAAFVPSAPQNSGAREDNEYWLVPDQRTGSLELFRITTPPYVRRSDPEPKFAARTDFYEFYWSDIMIGTTFEHVRAWMSGLLFRWPHQVPRRMMSAWLLLWLAVLLAVFLAAAGVFHLGAGGLSEPPHVAVATSDGATSAPGNGLATDDASAAQGSWWNPLYVGNVLTFLIPAFLFLGLSRNYRVARWPAEQRWRPRFSRISIIAVPLALLAVGWFLVPWDFILVPPTVFLLASALVGFAIQSFLVPYFGDVARYVRAAPNTVAKRAEVRERGLKLLRELHGGSSSHDSKVKDEGYQRIVIVAHSLGSIIAYDILNHFWAEAGPTGPHNPPKGQAMTALRKMDEFLEKQVSVKQGDAPGTLEGSTVKVLRSVFPQNFGRAEFRRLQRELSRALVDQKDGKGWRITDFVSLGSPLAHSEFLLARDGIELDQKIAERQIATCPPYPDPLTKSIRFPRQDEDAAPFRYAHHASVFAATRWTNIYDPHDAIFFGDIISGRVGAESDGGSSVADDLFGRGVHDVGVRMKRRWFAFSRLFTHTRYWSLDVTGELVNGKDTSQGPEATDGGERLDHVIELRKAVNLAEIFD